MNCTYYFICDEDVNKYSAMLKDQGLRITSINRGKINLDKIDQFGTFLFIDDISILGSSFEEIVESLNAIFYRNVTLICPINERLEKLNSFQSMSYLFLKCISTSLELAHINKIKSGQRNALMSGKKIGRNRTIDESKIANLHSQGLSIRGISELTGYSITSVWRYCQNSIF